MYCIRKARIKIQLLLKKCITDLCRAAFIVSAPYSGNVLQVSINLDSLVHFTQLRAFLMDIVEAELLIVVFI